MSRRTSKAGRIQYNMTERETLKRIMRLKRQAVMGLREDIRDIQARLFLLGLRDRFSLKINHHPDRELSSQLDCIDSLFRSLGK
jgi:hypothetical protein